MSRKPSFWGSMFWMLWMFSSRMYSKRGHRISSSVSQYLPAGEVVRHQMPAQLRDEGGVPVS